MISAYDQPAMSFGETVNNGRNQIIGFVALFWVAVEAAWKGDRSTTGARGNRGKTDFGRGVAAGTLNMNNPSQCVHGLSQQPR